MRHDVAHALLGMQPAPQPQRSDVRLHAPFWTRDDHHPEDGALHECTLATAVTLTGLTAWVGIVSGSGENTLINSVHPAHHLEPLLFSEDYSRNWRHFSTPVVGKLHCSIPRPPGITSSRCFCSRITPEFGAVLTRLRSEF